MTIVDVNVLLYAYNASAPYHRACSHWLESILAGDEVVGLPWPVLWGFLRVSTSSQMSVWSRPLTGAEACGVISALLAWRNVELVQPGPRHARILEDLIVQRRIHGPMVSDAVLAALAIEHDATLASTDRDFQRFDTLRWINPIAT